MRFLLISLLGLVTLGPATSLALTLEAFLQEATQRSEVLQSLEKRQLALEKEISSRDVSLASEFLITAENFNNDQDAVTFARRSRTRFFDATLNQAFSTGTLLSMSAGHDRSLIDNFGLRQFADWEVRLTQSLWRDSFGRSTRLRRQGDQQELENRKAALIYQKKMILIELEGFYWDYMTLLKEEEIRQKNLDVRRELLRWTKNRLQKIAAERVDLLQVEALVSGSELDLITVQNRLGTLKTQLQAALPGFDVSTLRADVNELHQSRSLRKLAEAPEDSSETPILWSALSSTALARQAELAAKQVRELLKPQFDVYMSYGQNGIADTFDEAWSRAGNQRFSGTRVGVNLRIPLNRQLTKKQEHSRFLEAEASTLEARNQLRTSVVGWTDLERRQKVVQTQTDEATKLARFQNEKVMEERRRYKIGRSTLLQLVTFEIEAATADVRQLTFLAELRKTESLARLYTTRSLP